MNAEEIIIRRINIKKFNNLKKTVENKLEEISKTGINTDELTNDLNNICDYYKLEISIYMESGQTPIIQKYIQKLYSFLENITTNYDDFIELYQTFESYKNDLLNTLTDLKMNTNINLIIKKLEELKNKDEFLNEKFTNYLFNIYKISYEYMKCELIQCKKSMLYEYFKSNEHDFWYINEFIKEEIENLKSSANIIFNYDKLEIALNNKSTYENHYMTENIIKELAICTNSDYYKKVCNIEFEKKYNKFNNLYHELYFSCTSNKKRRLIREKQISLNFNKLKKEYEEFMKDKDFLLEENEEDIVSIQILTLKILRATDNKM